MREVKLEDTVQVGHDSFVLAGVAGHNGLNCDISDWYLVLRIHNFAYH